MGLSATRAAKEAGVAVTTITRAIENGKLSAGRAPRGGYDIDPAELFRVFPATPSDSPKLHDATSATPKKQGATEALEVEVKMLRDMLQRADDTAADLRTRLDASEAAREREGEERRKLAVLLTHQAHQASPAPAAAPAPATGPDVPVSGQGRPVARFWHRWLGVVPSND